MPEDASKPVTWDDTRAWIGRNLAVGREGVDAVERGTIRRRLEVLELDCPLHHDDKVAKEMGYGGVIAPYTMIGTYSAGALWEPGDPTRWPTNDPNQTARPLVQQDEIPQPGTHGFATDGETEFIRPLYVGDRIHVKERKLISVVERTTSVGEGAFLTWETRFYNQRDELVAIGRNTRYVYNPHKREDKGGGE